MSQHPRQRHSADIESFRRALDCTKKENQDLHNIIKKMQEEKSQLEDKNSQLEDKNRQLEDKNRQLEDKNRQLEDKNRQLEDKNSQLEDKNSQLEDKNSQLEDKNSQLEAQIKNLPEISSQDQPGQDLQYKPDLQVLNAGWEILLKQSQQQITGLLEGKKKLQQRLQKLENIAEEKKQVEALADEMAGLFEKTEEKNEDLQKKLDEALQMNRQMIKEKQQQEAEHREMACELEDVKAKHQETQQKLQDVEKIHKETQHRLEDKTRQLECQIKDLPEISQQDQTSKDLQYKPELQVLNEVWEILLNQSQQHITGLLVGNKKLQQRFQELEGIAEVQKQMEEAINEITGLYVETEEKNINLQRKLDEALQTNRQMIKEKQQQEAEHREMACELEDVKAKHQETQQKLQDVEKYTKRRNTGWRTRPDSWRPKLKTSQKFPHRTKVVNICSTSLNYRS
ncbi:myosin-9-like [Archocentrus centrarchus]|uniref:myosin-9-like n=1 Tax=Archocentrus centrarchus TaxID=63155 RepID=UPI0011E9FAAA|nr:myosin-9-like [Archocentrus centrarchus]